MPPEDRLRPGYQASLGPTLWGMKPPALLLAALVLAGCTAPTVAVQVPAPSSTTATPTPAATETDESDDSADEVTVDKADFEIKLKITSKQCFGSAGCNVTTKASVTYTGVYDLDELPSLIDITYKIKGAEDPYTATIEMEDGKYSADTAVLSTRRSSSKLIAVVTSVETY